MRYANVHQVKGRRRFGDSQVMFVKMIRNYDVDIDDTNQSGIDQSPFQINQCVRWIIIDKTYRFHTALAPSTTSQMTNLTGTDAVQNII